MATEQNQPQSIAHDLGEQYETLHKVDLFDADDQGVAPFVVLPTGKSIKSLKPILDEYLTKPERREGMSAMRDVDSFIAMVLRFKSDHSAIFATPDRSAPKVLAVFDYHPKGAAVTDADWLGHAAQYAPPVSDEWKAWTAKNGTWMNQADFAAFVEERVTDLIVPEFDDPKLKTYANLVDGTWAKPSDMVSLSRSLQINVSKVVKNAQTLNTGEVSIIYEETHTNGGGQPLKIATLFTIAIPVFYAGGLYRLAARLRYRINGNALQWLYQLVRPDLSFDDAFKAIVDQVKTETSVPTFLGLPEQTPA